jgi:hypothetical protein
VLRTLSLCTCCRHYPGAATGRPCFAHSPRRISLPRKGCRVGLRIVLFEACSAFTRVTACTLALSPIRDTHSEGFSYFVTSIAAPVASGWSGRRVGLAPTGKRRLVTAHTLNGRWPRDMRRIPVWPARSLHGVWLRGRDAEASRLEGWRGGVGAVPHRSDKRADPSPTCALAAAPRFCVRCLQCALREIQTWQIYPIKRVQKWGVVLVGMHLRLVRLMLELLIEKKDY